MTDPKPSPCCSVMPYRDPVYYVSGAVKVSIGWVGRCPKCQRFVGGYKMVRPQSEAMAAILKRFTGASEMLMIEVQLKRPGAPLNFEDGPAGVLVPEGYRQEEA